MRTAAGAIGSVALALLGLALTPWQAEAPGIDRVAASVARQVPGERLAPRDPPGTRPTGGPLAGLTIALDPGHQLGNRRFPAQVTRLVDAGGFEKPCNTTGTATDAGYPESTVNLRIARLVQVRLERLGARVKLTRSSDSDALWGPCVDARGRFGKAVGARLMVSLHGDGSLSGGHGFHVIAPAERSPWTTDIAAASLRLAEDLRAGLDAAGVPRSTYVGGGTALDVRSDLGTLNLSDVPVAMVEIGNLRQADDAARATSAAGQQRYAAAVVDGIRRYLSR